MSSDNSVTAVSPAPTFASSSEWKNYALGDLAKFKYGKFLAKSELNDSGFDVFSGYGVVGFLPTYQFDDPQLLIVCRGEGGTGDVKMSPPKCSITNLSIVISPNEERVTKRFLYWSLKACDTHRLRTGSAQAQIVIGSLEKLRLVIPTDKEEQKYLAGILSALDDRITLLRETNATLEAIAQALFKSWFVDFDPVRAKQEGRDPEGMDEATAALFPDSFEESELGLVPRGWRVGTLGDVLMLRNERTKPSEQTKTLPYVPIENISAKVPFLQEYKSGEDANSSLILFRKGDILFGAMRPYFHKVCMAPFDGVTRTTVFTLYAKNPEASGFALWQAFQEATIEYATQHSEGSTIPYAKWYKSLELMPMIVPPVSLQVAFSEVVSSFVERANSNIHQAQTLATLRDTLLPRLISGQLRLPEAEAVLS